MTDATPQSETTSLPRRTGEVILAFLLLGLTSFGGSAAQLVAFRRAFVERRVWLTAEAFDELQALSQLLPGPLSSQLGMAIGHRRAGWIGALAAGVAFLTPVGLMMIALTLAPLRASWIHGLQIACAAVVIQALAGLIRPLRADPVRAGMALGATAGLLVASGPAAAILALAAGAGFGFALLRPAGPRAPIRRADSPPLAKGALAAFIVLLLLAPFLASVLDSAHLGLASVIYRSGALAFGTDHALLPLLRIEAVQRGWLGPGDLVGAYGLLQALPGPMTGIAGFVGTRIGGWSGGLTALAAVLAPGLLMVLAAAPLWDRMKGRLDLRGAVAGVNAVMVGLLAAALWDPVLTSAVRQPGDWALVAGALVFLTVAKLPAWAVVLIFAVGVGVFGA